MLRGGISGAFSKSFSSGFRKCPAELAARVRVVWLRKSTFFWGGVFRTSVATVPTQRISGHSQDRATHIGDRDPRRKEGCAYQKGRFCGR